MTIESKPKIEIIHSNSKWWLKSVPKEISWTNINILRFLRLYESFPVLWNFRHRYYKNSSKRLAAYKKITEILKLKNVDENACKQLVQELKRRYIQEKTFFRDENQCQPVWFHVLKNIIKQVLDSADPFDGQSENSTSSTFADCKDCCKKQNLVPPCHFYNASQEEIKSHETKDSLKSCKQCCNDEKISRMCEHINTSEEDLDKKYIKEQKIDNGEIMCHTILNNDMNAAVTNFKKCFDQIFQLVSLNINHSDSNATETNKKSNKDPCDSQNSSESDEDKNCWCSIFKESSLPTPTSSFTDKDFNPQDFSMYQIGKIKNVEYQENIKNVDSISESQESLMVDEKKGLFIDSSRFCGKRISLVLKYATDVMNGNVEIIEPRGHFGAYTNDQSKVYPLQLEM